MEGSQDRAGTQVSRPMTAEILRRARIACRKFGGVGQGTSPRVTGSFKRDAAAATKFWRTGADLLAKLPKKAATNGRTTTRSRHHHFRLPARARRFPSDGTPTRSIASSPKISPSFVRVDELAYDAGKLVPGLTPTRKQVDAECALMQSEKDGVEDRPGDFSRSSACRS